MLGLKLATDPRWVNIVAENIEEILTDHAYCEQKAATNAIRIVIQNPENTDDVDAMLEISKEELLHVQLVEEKIKLIKPAERKIQVTVKAIYNKEGEAMGSEPHAKQRINVKLNKTREELIFSEEVNDPKGWIRE